MTGKRYYAHKHLLQGNKVHDKICHNFMGLDETVEHMNNQYLKYKQLKEENGQLKDALNQRTEQCDTYYKENEQLKETIKEVTELLEEEVDLFSDKATKHDINAYVELRELDNKDAFYMATATKKAINMLKELI